MATSTSQEKGGGGLLGLCHHILNVEIRRASVRLTRPLLAQCVCFASPYNSMSRARAGNATWCMDAAAPIPLRVSPAAPSISGLTEPHCPVFCLLLSFLSSCWFSQSICLVLLLSHPLFVFPALCLSDSLFFFLFFFINWTSWTELFKNFIQWLFKFSIPLTPSPFFPLVYPPL